MTTQLRTLHGKVQVFSSFLNTILDRADITPIPDHLVEAYKEQELGRAPKGDFVGRLFDKLGIQNFQLNGVFETLMLAGLAVVLVGVVGAVSGGVHLVYHSLYNTASAAWAMYALKFGGGGAIIGGGALFYMACKLDGKYISLGLGPARWVVVPAEDMNYIPLFVQERMMRILHLDSSVRFEVADLRQNKYSLDPILYAVLGNERRAITVWKHDVEVFLSSN